MDVSDKWAAYCFDNAVGDFGRAVEAELSRVDGKTQKDIDAKAENTLRHWLGLPKRYRNPAGPTPAPKEGEQ